LLFSEIWNGANAEAIWTTVGAGLKEGHFYLSHLDTGDGVIQLGVALGCSVALWGLIPTIFQFIKEKNYAFAVFAVLNSLIILTAILGLV
ncbi:MAG TPA: hypothetical protein GX697_04685, partial [Firmicutes bacterium]|nr:hypothetical protein [Bacillota bacterium]